MRRIVLMSVMAIFAIMCVSCSSSKKSTAVVSTISKDKSLEGENVMVETTKLSGIEKVDELSDDGSDIVKKAYKWYAGIGKADDKQMAIEIAEREARATIARVISTMVKDKAERGALVNNGEVQKALESYWSQMSENVQKACEPFGDTKIEYNPTTKMYTVTAKVGMRGDRFNSMINSAGSYNPKNLNGEQLQQFIEVNKSIIEAAKGE